MLLVCRPLITYFSFPGLIIFAKKYAPSLFEMNLYETQERTALVTTICGVAGSGGLKNAVLIFGWKRGCLFMLERAVGITAVCL